MMGNIVGSVGRINGGGDGWRCEMMRAQSKAGANAGGKGVETKKEGLHLLLWLLA